MSCDNLRRVSDLGREVLFESVQSSGDNKELDTCLFEATLKEVEKGFIQGPIGKNELSAGFTLTKRFPVKQKNKRFAPLTTTKRPWLTLQSARVKVQPYTP